MMKNPFMIWKEFRWETATFVVLRPLHLWSGRQYHRILLRGALHRIGHELTPERDEVRTSTDRIRR